MVNCTKEKTDNKICPAYVVFKNFFDSYLLERNLEKTLSLLDEDLFCLGMGKDEVAFNKTEITELIKCELKLVSESIDYKVTTFFDKQIAENIWNVFAQIDTTLPTTQITYTTRFSGCIKVEGNAGVILSMHMSKGCYVMEELKSFSSKFVSGNIPPGDLKAEQTVFDILCQSMPGGIISGYAAEGFPLYFVNRNFLELLGYSSYEEYSDAVDGMGINSIHPDDRELVNKTVMQSYHVNEQYNVEYRIRHKNGSYIHVYDIGKKIVTPDNREVVVCILFDMTENVKLRNLLTKESYYDELTGIYNRRGGMRIIERALEEEKPYSFAIFDIDNLKLLNDLYNHKVGDHALSSFAELMTKCFDEQTTLSRFGGDEFIAFLPVKQQEAHMEKVLTALQEDFNEFIQKNYPKSNASVSIGCVTGSKQTTFDGLYQVADKLMYSIKKNGKRGCKIVELE